MKLIYTYFFQYIYILFNYESMLTHVHLHVFVRHYTNACIFFQKKVSKTKIFFTFAGQNVFWVLLGYH